MRDSLLQTAQITDIRQHEVTELIDLRRAAIRCSEMLGLRLSFTDLFVRASALTLREVPELNASLTDDGRLVQHDDVNIGVAVALADGLIVPVLRQADQLSIADIHAQLSSLVARARAGQADTADVSGGTFTLTNIGSYGSHAATPILVSGQVGILGTGAFLDTPIVRGGDVVAGTVMYTSLTIDHRVVDGETAGRFQTIFGRYLAEPDALVRPVKRGHPA